MLQSVRPSDLPVIILRLCCFVFVLHYFLYLFSVQIGILMPSNMVYLCSWLLQSIWLFPSLSASVGHACFIMVIAGLQLWVVFLMQILFCYRYPKATEIFEGIARQSINNNLLKYGVRGILLNAGICQLCRGDPVAITNSLERYQVCIGSVLILISKCVPLSSFIEMFCYNFAGNWPNFLWDTGIQAFSCMNTYLPFFFLDSCSLHAWFLCNITSSANNKI